MDNQTFALVLWNMGEIYAANARVEGMVAENRHREQCGNSIAYGEEAFNQEAAFIQQHALAIRERAG